MWYHSPAMKALMNAIKNHKTVVFFDLEATGISHEIIEIGAFKVILHEDGRFKKVFKPYHSYVLPKTRVGVTVTKLTGITDEFLTKNAVPFRVVQKGLATYVGKEYKNALFICYGDQDPQMFIHSAEHNMDASMEEAKFVSHHCFDFLRFFSRFITGENGNPISLTKACDLFGIKPYGQAHSATSDAYGLMKLFEQMQVNKKLVLAEYEKTLCKGRAIPDSFKELIAKLQKEGKITHADFRKALEDAIS